MADKLPAITNNEQAHRYEVTVDGHLARLDYTRKDGTVTMTHTIVPDQLEGRGIGSALAKAALDDARAGGLSVVPQCPFVGAYIRRHQEYLDIVDGAYQDRFRA